MADANKCFFNKIVQIPMPIVNIGLYKSKYESDLWRNDQKTNSGGEVLFAIELKKRRHKIHRLGKHLHCDLFPDSRSVLAC